MMVFVKEKNNYKTASPYETISKIRGILKENDIFVVESSWYLNPGNLRSVSLSMVDIPAASNGKGVNEEYALASAYAEFMERLQNLALLKERFGNQEIKHILMPDYKIVQYKDFIAERPELVQRMFPGIELQELREMLAEESGVFYPYYSYRTGITVYLPHELLRVSLGTNGMCAGNTPQEALIQGVCEVYERYVLKLLYEYNAVTFPVVPDSFMERFPQWQNIELLREQGYEVLVKDCSLKGKVPVAGVLIQKDGKALFNLGASPEFSIAVERCITELFQGVHFSQMEQLLKPIIINDKDNTVLPFSSEEKRQEYIYLQNLKTGKANVNRQVFDHSEPFRESSLFFESDLTNGAVLKKLLDTALSFDTDVFIRDVSLLGFPSFQVYVPGLSEVCNVSIMEFKLKAHDLPRARKILYNLKNSAKDDLKHLITTLENLIDDPYVGRENSFKTLHNLHITEDALLNNLDPENVLVILYYRLGDYHNAKTIMERYLQEKLSKEHYADPPRFAMPHIYLYRYMELLSGGYSLTEAKKQLEEKIENAAGGSEVKNEYNKIISEIYDSLSDEEKLSGLLGIPECKSCSNCGYSSVCNTPRLKGLMENLQRRAAAYNVNQEDIGSYLCS